MSNEIGKTHAQLLLKTLPTYYKTSISGGFQYAESKIANPVAFPPDPSTHPPLTKSGYLAVQKSTSWMDGIVCQMAVGNKRVLLSLYQISSVGSHINVRMTQLQTFSFTMI